MSLKGHGNYGKSKVTSHKIISDSKNKFFSKFGGSNKKVKL